MNHTSVGILAHVDAGKTTCIESMLLESQVIRKAGRVDNQDCFLDFDSQERARGITIFSKEAGLNWKDMHLDILDTPGHADFSAEMERVLSVLDMAVVVVSGLDGVQSHTKTIWKCLDHYHIPSILFVNKMDLARHDKEELLEDIRAQLSEGAVVLEDESWMEQIAGLDDDLLEKFAETGKLDQEDFQHAFEKGIAHPVLFGSALKNLGVDALLDCIALMAPEKQYPEAFGARVFKVTQDENGASWTHMRLTGGSLAPKDMIGEQKADQLRKVQGRQLLPVQSAQAGEIVAVKGLENITPGDGLGFEESLQASLLESCLEYEMILPAGCDPADMSGVCRLLTMEDPSLQIEYSEAKKAILIHLMGDIQKEILRQRIYDKSGVWVEFGPGAIIYKETLKEKACGYGHFEPLRHYAEVHLRLEPLKRGSGMLFSSELSRDILSLNWQRQILSSLQAKTHKGVLDGWPLTDVKVILTQGRAHAKHTSGGDFRQAANRALRQGLMSAGTVLLEPCFSFTLKTPSSFLSRILYELETKEASVSVSSEDEQWVSIQGTGPVRTLLNFQSELPALSKGQASIVMENAGYRECKNPQSVISGTYDPCADLKNSPDSVFCTQGSSQIVPWDEAPEWMHIPIEQRSESVSVNKYSRISEEDARKAFASAGGQNQSKKKKPIEKAPARKALKMDYQEISPASSLPTCLIVDGYNMIYSWPELSALAKTSLHAARSRLMDLVVNYQGYKGWSLIVVFDGWKRNDNPGSIHNKGNSSMVFTPTGQSADAWIEEKVKKLKGKFHIVAATSDSLIQNSVLSHGARRISARELEMEVHSVNKKAMEALQRRSF